MEKGRFFQALHYLRHKATIEDKLKLQIISSCWHANPKKRLTTSNILEELNSLAAPQPLPKSTSRKLSSLKQLLRDLNPFSETSNQPPIAKELLTKITTVVRDPITGLVLDDHVHMLKTYPRTFTGSDIVDWIIAYAKVIRPVANSAAEWLLLNGHIIDAIPFTEDATLTFHDDSESLYKFP